MKKCYKRRLHRIIIEVETWFLFNKPERKLGNKIWVTNQSKQSTTANSNNESSVRNCL